MNLNKKVTNIFIFKNADCLLTLCCKLEVLFIELCVVDMAEISLAVEEPNK